MGQNDQSIAHRISTYMYIFIFWACRLHFQIKKWKLCRHELFAANVLASVVKFWNVVARDTFWPELFSNIYHVPDIQDTFKVKTEIKTAFWPMLHTKVTLWRRTFWPEACFPQINFRYYIIWKFWRKSFGRILRIIYVKC